MTEWIGLAVVPIAGWTLNKVTKDSERIAVVEQIVTDIRDSLKRLEDHFYAEGQARRHAEDASNRRSRS